TTLFRSRYDREITPGTFLERCEHLRNCSFRQRLAAHIAYYAYHCARRNGLHECVLLSDRIFIRPQESGEFAIDHHFRRGAAVCRRLRQPAAQQWNSERVEVVACHPDLLPHYPFTIVLNGFELKADACPTAHGKFIHHRSRGHSW